MHREMRTLLAALLLLPLLAACLPVPHQLELTPRISGTVSRAGSPVSGAHLHITAEGAGLSGDAVSDGDGRFQLASLSQLAMSTSLLQDASYGFVLELSSEGADYPGLTLTEQGFPPRELLLTCDLAHPQGLGGDMHYCRRR